MDARNQRRAGSGQRVVGCHRKRRSYLSERGVGTEIYYPVPMHQQECFADLQVDPDSLVQTEIASREILNLPIFPSLTVAQQQQVVGAIGEYYSSGARVAA